MNDQLTIVEINKLIDSEQFSEREIEKLKLDERKGVQKLLDRYEKQLKIKKQQESLFNSMLVYEKNLYKLGNNFVAGMDEAGRGPLAGPVVAAAVILKKDFYLPGLNDSKQLNKQTRENFFEIIKEEAISVGIGIIHSEEIDKLNIYQATKKAMKVAIQQLNPIPDHVLIDAVPLDNLPCTSDSITKGDQKSISIAAASVIAKVTRDNLMEELHNSYPHYNFASNKGYGTKEHLEAIIQCGVSPYHRRSFAPVKDVVNE
ncbi:ribonuclease HII [Aquibacillus halophilus]|uniref:Ribonuclease HII n=1 Tax=Aquibacillus halophilus TaxID=930132 RepID=A0A6A8DLX8_9BACI|nr:ribonuclease HII [Aquibacillus halophilus]MRH42242.1 ribonuclease HII [Aquibacillus halophilus]